jgi:hypothetical protein
MFIMHAFINGHYKWNGLEERLANAWECILSSSHGVELDAGFRLRLNALWELSARGREPEGAQFP